MPSNKIKVTRNQYGNYKGYIDGKRVQESGCEFDIQYWMMETLASTPRLSISKTSYFTSKDNELFIKRFEESLTCKSTT